MKKVMRWCLLIFVSALVGGCIKNEEAGEASAKKNEPPKTEIRTDFDWMVGDWQRTNEKPDHITIERWKKISEEHYRGVSFTTLRGDTTFFEMMELKYSEDHWDLSVSLGRDKEGTKFVERESGPEYGEFLNPENSFPKTIRYWRSGDSLKAQISGGEMEMDFDLIPVASAK